MPTLIVYGDRDKYLGERDLPYLEKIPNHKTVKVEDAGHACYLDQPEIWHTELKKFLDGLS